MPDLTINRGLQNFVSFRRKANLSESTESYINKTGKPCLIE